jgi:hypothetical protein
MRTKKRANRVFVLVLDQWTRNDQKDFEDFWGYKRNDDDKGLYNWIAEKQLEAYLKRNPNSIVVE